MEKSTVGLMMTRPGRHSMTPLSARSSYDNENRVCSSRVMELPDVAENSLRVASEKHVAENSPRVASEKQHGAASDNT